MRIVQSKRETGVKTRIIIYLLPASGAYHAREHDFFIQETGMCALLLIAPEGSVT